MLFPLLQQRILSNMNGSGPKAVPISSLSIQSFHNDSPPFTGSADSPPPHGQPSYLDLDVSFSSAATTATTTNTSSSSSSSSSSSGAPLPPSSPQPPSSSSFSSTSSPASSSVPMSHHSNSTTNSHSHSHSYPQPPSRPHSQPQPQPQTNSLSSPPTNQVTRINSSLSQPPALRTRQTSQPVLPPSPSASTRTIKPIRPYHSDGPPSTDSARPAPSPSSQTIVPPYNHGEPVASPYAVRPSLTPSLISAFDQATLHSLPQTDGDGEGDIDGEADALSLVGPERLLPSLGDSGKYLRGEGDYLFPKHRLKSVWDDQEKTPLVIVACGSFSPPTYLHLRMFEMAKDQILESDQYEILGGYYSPVSDHYKKAGLAPAQDRVKMCELAVESTSTWLMVDPWEAGQESYQRTAVVLQHFEEELNGGPNGGVRTKNGGRQRIKIMLLAGGDLIESFGHPGVWAPDDLHVILGQFGCLIVERAGSDVWAFLLSHDILYHHRRNIIVVKQLIYNDISSTKVRLFVRRAMSIKYLLPNSVIQYIYDQKLYTSEAPAVPLEAVTTTSPPPRTVPPTPSASTERKKFFTNDADSGHANTGRTSSS